MFGVELYFVVCYNMRKGGGIAMSKVMYCCVCGKICHVMFSKKCNFCKSKMLLLSEDMKYKYHIFVEDWSEISREEMIQRKEDFVKNEISDNPIFSIELYIKQVERQRCTNQQIEEYHQHQMEEQELKINQQIQKLLDKQNCIPKCPICSSQNIKKITFSNRAVKTVAFGVIGAMDDSGKTYQCNNCGSKF